MSPSGAFAPEAPLKPPGVRRVFFVPTGLGFPYRPGLEDYVLRGLRAITPHVQVPRGPEPLWRQVARFRPDLVLTLFGPSLGPGTVQAIRNLGYPIAVWATEDPYYSDLTLAHARRFDYVFTIDSGCVKPYRDAGCRRVGHVPLGFDPQTYHPGDVPARYESDVCFVGAAFSNRLEIIDQLADFLKDRRVAIVGPGWERLRHYGQLRHLIRNEIVSPEEARLYYAGAKIVLNIHRQPDDDLLNLNRLRIEARTPNGRTFEIGACRTLQITDGRPDLAHWYVIGRDLEVFTDADDLRRKLEYYLAHDDVRERVAASGYEKTRRHTYRERLLAILQATRSAPAGPALRHIVGAPRPVAPVADRTVAAALASRPPGVATPVGRWPQPQAVRPPRGGGLP